MGIPLDDFIAGAAARIPVGRVGQPEDVAHAVSYLVSEAASFVSGQVLYLAGGPTGWAAGTTRATDLCCREEVRR